MGTVEQILIAQRTGVCYGVREAIDKAKLARADGKQTHTLGHARSLGGRRTSGSLVVGR